MPDTQLIPMSLTEIPEDDAFSCPLSPATLTDMEHFEAKRNSDLTFTSHKRSLSEATSINETKPLTRMASTPVSINVNSIAVPDKRQTSGVPCTRQTSSIPSPTQITEQTAHSIEDYELFITCYRLRFAIVLGFVVPPLAVYLAVYCFFTISPRLREADEETKFFGVHSETKKDLILAWRWLIFSYCSALIAVLEIAIIVSVVLSVT